MQEVKKLNLLETREVSKTFGGLCAVSKVDFHVESKEIVGLIGPNGAGKSTFFNLITGVDEPTSGEIRMGGKKINGLKPYDIAYMGCLLYTSDAADEEDSVDLGG